MNFPEIYSATGMMELIQKIGFLPLLDSGIMNPNVNKPHA